MLPLFAFRRKQLSKHCRCVVRQPPAGLPTWGTLLTLTPALSSVTEDDCGSGSTHRYLLCVWYMLTSVCKLVCTCTLTVVFPKLARLAARKPQRSSGLGSHSAGVAGGCVHAQVFFDVTVLFLRGCWGFELRSSWLHNKRSYPLILISLAKGPHLNAPLWPFLWVRSDHQDSFCNSGQNEGT